MRSAEGILLMRKEIKVSQVWLPLTVVPNSPQARLRMVKFATFFQLFLGAKFIEGSAFFTLSRRQWLCQRKRDFHIAIDY